MHIRRSEQTREYIMISHALECCLLRMRKYSPALELAILYRFSAKWVC